MPPTHSGTTLLSGVVYFGSGSYISTRAERSYRPIRGFFIVSAGTERGHDLEKWKEQNYRNYRTGYVYVRKILKKRQCAYEVLTNDLHQQGIWEQKDHVSRECLLLASVAKVGQEEQLRSARDERPS
jgi:hypothetical protein